MNRRGFLKKMGLGAVAVVATPVAVLAAKQVQQPKSGLLKGEIGHYEGVRFHAKPMLTDNDAEFMPIEQYMSDALGKQMRDRLDEIAFSQMYNGTGIVYS